MVKLIAMSYLAIIMLMTLVSQSLGQQEHSNGLVMLTPRFRFFPFQYYVAADSMPTDAQRVRRANKLANLMRLGKRNAPVSRDQAPSANAAIPWIYVNMGTIPEAKTSYITGSALH